MSQRHQYQRSASSPFARKLDSSSSASSENSVSGGGGGGGVARLGRSRDRKAVSSSLQAGRRRDSKKEVSVEWQRSFL